jgi:stage V sporulation protein G
MEITEVRVFPVDEERLKAYVTITIDDCFVVRDLKVINGNNGLFVAMPSKKRKDGTFRDTAHPVNNETREAIEKKVLTAYEQELATPGSTRGSSETTDANESTAGTTEDASTEES